MNQPSYFALAAFLVGLSLVFLAGCTPTTTVTPANVHNDPQALIEQDAPGDQGKNKPAEAPAADPNQPPGKLIAEYWERHSLAGTRIGYAHYRIEEVPGDDPQHRTLIRTTSQTEMSIERSGEPVKQTYTVRSWDTPDGHLVRCESEEQSGSEKKITRARVSADQKELTLETGSGDNLRQTTIPWKPEYRGFFGVEQALRQAPLQPNEERTIVQLTPILNLVATNHLQAANEESVSLPDGSAKLLKVSGEAKLSYMGQQIISPTTMWLNEQGDVLRSVMPNQQLEVVRVSRELALAVEPNQPKQDLIENFVVKLTPDLKNPQQTKRVVYRAKVKDGSLAGVFAEGLSQRVKLINEQTAEIEVLAVNPETAIPATFSIAQPSAGDSAPNALIQSNTPRIERLAMAPRHPANESFAIARDLEKLVHKGIAKKNFSQAFASAAEVIQSMQGDCTEHSVLLAALCRARKIPARCEIGLVYVPEKHGFAYHMWNEVWTGDRWVPLDAMWGQDQVPADHIKLADTNLEGADALAAFLPVMQVFGRLQLEVVEAE